MSDTYSSDRRRDPNHYIDPNNQGSLIKHVIQYYETGKEVANLLVQKIIEQISQGKISKLPSEEDKMPGWEKEIQKFVERHKDFCLEDPDVSAPLSILRDVFAIHIDRVAALKKKYKVVHDSTLLEFYFKEKQLSLNDYNNIKAFFATMADAAFSNSLLELYIQQELELIAPWVEINRILEAHHFKYRVQIVEGNSSNKDRNFILTRNIGEGTAKISPNDLSSGERVVLRLLSQLFYFRGITADGKNPAEIKPLDVMLLDEPDRHLDPELCQQMYEIIYEEFVKKHHVQVFLTTHRPDAVFFAPDNSIYTIGEGTKLISDKESVINRMTSHIIAPVINQRSATSILSGGKLTVLEDINYVLAENEDDVKFYNIIYQKLKNGHPSAVAKKTQLIFMPVGIRLDSIEKDKGELQGTADKIENIAKNLADQDTKAALDNLLASLKQQINKLADKDFGGGSSAVKSKVNKIPRYCGQYDVHGRVKGNEYLKEVANETHTQNVFFGVIDNDKSVRKNTTSSEGKVHAIDVYSFENYLCMPLNLFYYIRKNFPMAYQGSTQDQLEPFFKSQDVNFEQGSGTQEQLQSISNWVEAYLKQQLDDRKKELSTWLIDQLNLVKTNLPDELGKLSDNSGKSTIEQWIESYINRTYSKWNIFNNTNTDKVEVIGRQTITCRKSFSTTQGHDLVKIMCKLMPGNGSERPVDNPFVSFNEYFKSDEKEMKKKFSDNEYFKSGEKEMKNKFSEILNRTLKSEEISEKKMEQEMTKRLLKSLEEMPVAYLPKSLLELIERLQNSEEVKK